VVRRYLVVGIMATLLVAVFAVISHDGGSRHLAAPAVAAVATTIVPTTVPTTTTTDPGSLAQTEARPSGSDPAFQARMMLLWQAITTGHVGVALPAFFPLSAYKKVKAVRDPASDWQHRLVADFDADIARVHASLGPGASSATLTTVVVPVARATWVRPGAEVNRIGYWRVYDTMMNFQNGGRPGSLVVISLISWRGQWYVVHFRTPPH
jgi:hypothetical protein